MRIEAIDFFYLSMPEVLDIGDGSQDALLVRVAGGGDVGWGECEAAPLPSIAGLICPMSHSACKPVQSSVLGQTLGSVEDITRIGKTYSDSTFRFFETYNVVAFLYLVMTVGLALLVRYLEKRMPSR